MKPIDKKSFVLYNDLLQHVETLSMEQRGLLFTAILRHENGLAPPEMDGAVGMAFSFIRSTLDRDGEKYEAIVEKRRATGALGALAKAKKQALANASFAGVPQANTADNVTDNEIDNDNETEIDSVNVTVTDTDSDIHTGPDPCDPLNDLLHLKVSLKGYQ